MRKHIPLLVILGLYVICILAANPQGEFPLNDDWSYTRSAFGLSSGDGLKIDPWSAPSLVGQALYGGLLTAIFSQRFLVLRASTLLLSCGTLLLLWGICRRAGFPNNLTCILLLAWAFNPLQFSLSFTYMTEIPFIFFAVLGLYLFTVHLDEERFFFLLLSAAAFGYAFLIRQTALMFVLALACSILVDERMKLRVRLRQLAPVVLVAGIFVSGYYAWSLLRGGATAAVGRKFDLLSRIESRQIIGNGLGMLFYLSFMLLPLWLFLVPSIRRFVRESKRLLPIAVPAAFGALAVFGMWWFHASYTPGEYLPSASYHAQMPYLLNVLYDTGLGPLTLDPDYYAPPPTPTYPGIWAMLTMAAGAGIIAAGTLSFLGLRKIRAQGVSQKKRSLIVFALVSFFLLAGFEILFSHLQEGGLFDRHILILLFPLTLLIGTLWSGQRFSNGAFSVSLIAVAVFAAFSVAGTHDYMEWNRIRWDMGRGLVARGVDPLAIVGGFEFNAWYNYDTFVARGRTAQTSHWWYDRRDYVITMLVLDGYEVREAKAFFSWVHLRPIKIYLLQEAGRPNPEP